MTSRRNGAGMQGEDDGTGRCVDAALDNAQVYMDMGTDTDMLRAGRL
jgi:hypothetical protein